jgi:hypothetical protein
LDEQTENIQPLPETEAGNDLRDENERPAVPGQGGSSTFFLLPLVFSIFLFVGFIQEPYHKTDSKKRVVTGDISQQDDDVPKINFSALLAAEEFSKNLRDTVYTDGDMWLELRIDQQILYVHYRSGRTKTYNVSTGNKFLSKGIESRPGLFAVFMKEEIHKSSQFNNAQMNYYMPYNMGIGFHGLPGSGYYGFLGKQPSSHGCIRMRNEDVKELFKETKIGTIVLAHRGHTARVVAFAPEGFKNDALYSKEEYMNMLAYNLGAIMEGKYFINPPKRFILDGTVLPKSGVNVVNNEDIPEKQILPFSIAKIRMKTDFFSGNKFVSKDISGSGSYAELFGSPDSDSVVTENTSQVTADPQMIKKYVYNPVGILPYFPPNK